jgi:motility quorum-sensing regulator / GCU-specific mRNA interferase toxin
MTEKRKPSHNLKAFKTAFSSVERLNATESAVRPAIVIGFKRNDIVATIQTMQPSQLHKSMTSYADHRVWQDV